MIRRTLVPWRHRRAKLMPSARAVAPRGRQRPRAVRRVVNMAVENTPGSRFWREQLRRERSHGWPVPGPIQSSSRRRTSEVLETADVVGWTRNARLCLDEYTCQTPFLEKPTLALGPL